MAWGHVKSAEVLPTSIDKQKSQESKNPRTCQNSRCRSRKTGQVLKSALRLPTSTLAADEAEGGRRRASTRRLLLDCDGGSGDEGSTGRVWTQALHSDDGRGFDGRYLELPRITNSQNSQESQNRSLDTLPRSYTTQNPGSSLRHEQSLVISLPNHTGQGRNRTETQWNRTEKMVEQTAGRSPHCGPPPELLAVPRVL